VTRLTVVPLRSSLIQGNDKNLWAALHPGWNSNSNNNNSLGARLLKTAHFDGKSRRGDTDDVGAASKIVWSSLIVRTVQFGPDEPCLRKKHSRMTTVTNNPTAKTT
jgi:hypothetical protein